MEHIPQFKNPKPEEHDWCFVCNRASEQIDFATCDSCYKKIYTGIISLGSTEDIINFKRKIDDMEPKKRCQCTICSK